MIGKNILLSLEMLKMKFNWFKFFGLTILLISILIIAKVANAGEKSEWLNENPCMIKVVITEYRKSVMIASVYLQKHKL